MAQPRWSVERFDGNPALEPDPERWWESKAVFNPGALYEAGRVHLVYRAIGDTDTSVLGYASSPDGLHFDERLEEPIYVPREPFEGVRTVSPRLVSYGSGYVSGGGGMGGCEDPRLTRIEDRVFMTYVAYDGYSPPRTALSSIAYHDFMARSWRWRKPVLISPPGEIDKNACILPEKVNGKYVIFHRVFPDILIDFLDDLDFDGKTKWLTGEFKIRTRADYWDSRKVGAGPPPIKTEKGWLLIYHAIGEQAPDSYKIGAMLLDSQDPTRVLARSPEPIMEPQAWYEREGWKSNVVYPCGAVVIGERLFIYYGAADRVVCVASVNLDGLLEQLIGARARVPAYTVAPPAEPAAPGATTEKRRRIQAYCFKCRDRRIMKNTRAVTLKNGRPAMQGVCPECGTRMFRMGKGASR
jgi:predicted GH43/DUF377 family glycosyl hydrolase